MKKYILYILTGVAACGLCSCEDALDRYPKDRLTPDNFFHTEEECQLYTNDFYTMFPSAGTIYGETADIIAKTTLTSEVLGNRTVPATAGSWKWEKLRDINFFLQYSSNCADEHVRLEYEGVARFFRAWFYFEKVKHYGDVPWVDRPIDAGDPLLFEKGRDPREMVMQKVIEDLDFAVTNLPVERSVYRVTRWAALALKSRVCLFEGTFRKYHGLKDWESYLTACATASKRFTDESGYSVYTTGTTPYLNLFSSLKALDTEIVLARAYNTAIGLKHDVNGYLTSITMGRPGLLKNIANMYLMKDGTPFTSQPGWETMQLPEESKNRDGRFAQTVRTPGYKRIDDTALSAPNLAATMTGYQLVKYLQSAKYDSYNASTNDLPLLRAAEVMLNYAEAKAELGTLTQEDIDLAIKPLRDRAGVANLSLTKANASPDPYLASPETGYANVTGEQGRDPRNPPRTHRRTADGEPPLLGHHALEGGQAFRKTLHGAVFPRHGVLRPEQRRRGRRLHLVRLEARDLGPGGLRAEQGDLLERGRQRLHHYPYGLRPFVERGARLPLSRAHRRPGADPGRHYAEPRLERRPEFLT